MKTFEVKINQFIPSAYELFLFNRQAQTVLQKAEHSILFQLVNNNLSFADFTIFINGNYAYSPLQAPFGSIQFKSDLEPSAIDYFLDEVLANIQAHQINKLTITNYPDCYSNTSSILNDIFIRKGFKVQVTELNYHLPIAGSFESHLHDSELRRLRKCEEAGFQLKIGKGEYLVEMYKQIVDTRSRKGFPLSMGFDKIQELFKQFPNDYISFTIWDESILLASSIGVLVSSDILYYFLPGDNERYKSYSPTVQLIKGMYNFCQLNNFKILDLGISTSGGIRNEGLIRFKENLGAVMTKKHIYEYSNDLN